LPTGTRATSRSARRSTTSSTALPAFAGATPLIRAMNASSSPTRIQSYSGTSSGT